MMKLFAVLGALTLLGLPPLVYPAFAEATPKPFQRIDHIPPDKAVIYFFRGDRNDLIDYEPPAEPHTIGTDDPMDIEQESGPLNFQLQPSSHKKVFIAPGTYRFKSSQALVKITVEAGKEYCIRGLLAKELIMAAKTEGIEKVPLDYCMFHINHTFEMP
jgi:hypothetical protein